MLPITVFVHYISPLYSDIYCYALKWRYSMIHYVVHIMLQFFVVLLKCDYWIFGKFTIIIPDKLPKIETWNFQHLFPHENTVRYGYLYYCGLILNLCSHFPVKRCVRRKTRTGHLISQHSCTSDILALNYLIW